MLTVCVLMFGVLLPPHSSWVCWRQWSPADTHTGRSPLYWCTLHFYTATCDCWVLNTRSHLGTERHAWVLKWHNMFQSHDIVCVACILCLCDCSLTNAGHAGQVQGVSIKAVAGITLLNPHTPTVLTAVQYPTLLCSQTLKCLVWIYSTKGQQSVLLWNQ